MGRGLPFLVQSYSLQSLCRGHILFCTLSPGSMDRNTEDSNGESQTNILFHEFCASFFFSSVGGFIVRMMFHPELVLTILFVVTRCWLSSILGKKEIRHANYIIFKDYVSESRLSEEFHHVLVTSASGN